MQKTKQMLAVIVLYKMRAEESVAYTCLNSIMASDELTSAFIELMICDNTPSEQPAPPGFNGLYVRDTTNPGLAKCYNSALQKAVAIGAPWLLLIDQDTALTADYVAEAVALAKSLEENDRVFAFVPKLMQFGRVLSPHLPLTFRHPKALNEAAYGISEVRIYPYNSGAVLRVTALEAIGGFPEMFWLDYLDHATFHSLQSQGGRIFVMRAALEHELSSNQSERLDDPTFLARQQNILAAEHAFYQQYGTRQDRIYHHTRLLWKAWKALRVGALRRSVLLLKVAMRI